MKAASLSGDVRLPHSHVAGRSRSLPRTWKTAPSASIGHTASTLSLRHGDDPPLGEGSSYAADQPGH